MMEDMGYPMRSGRERRCGNRALEPGCRSGSLGEGRNARLWVQIMPELTKLIPVQNCNGYESPNQRSQRSRKSDQSTRRLPLQICIRLLMLWDLKEQYAIFSLLDIRKNRCCK